MRSQREDPESLVKKVKNSILKNRQSQLFYKAFLKPIQIALKTYSTQKQMDKIGCLPYGLKQVLKIDIGDNKYTLVDFSSIDQKIDNYSKNNEHHLQDIRQAYCDNLISLMKTSNNKQGIKIAICVCMYSQDKTMLKKTLSGISQNIEVFHQNGYEYNQIGVFVIMDGIEVVDPSIQQLFQEFQKQNNIYLSDDVQPTDPRDLIDQQRQVEDEEVDNLSHLIFSQQEFHDRKKRRFSQRKKQYKLFKDMIKQIQAQQKDKTLTYDSLKPLVQRFFIQKARQQYKKDYAASDDEAKKIQQTALLQKYAQNLKRSTPIIRQALNQAKKFCIEYLSTRDNLALLNSYRITIQNSRNAFKRNSHQDDGQNYKMNQQEQQFLVNTIKMNLFMITKYKNRGKLSSHNWFFNGFCQQLKPTYAVLLDVGLTPQRQALYKMCHYMQKNKEQKIGGVCGYMGLRIQKLDYDQQVSDQSVDCITALSLKLVDIQRAQQFQYHFAHLIDKPFQSSFDFIHVLPGAFSAYRMQALRPADSSHDSKLLKQYFKSIDENAVSVSYKSYKFTTWQTIMKVILPEWLYYSTCCYGKPPQDSYQKLLYDQNVYLAEDRTLCMGIHQNGFKLSYLPDANAWVDPIKTLYGLLGQRKRWINGSFFAFQKVKQTLSSSSQSNFCLKIQIFYLTFMNMMSYIAPALFMYTVHIAMYTFQQNVIFTILQNLKLLSRTDPQSRIKLVQLFVYLVDLIYVMIFLGLVFFSMHLTNRESKFKTFFYGVSTTYGVFSMAVFGVLVYDIISGFVSGKNTFLLDNPWFVQSIAGGQAIINSLRYIMLGIMGLYAVPILVFMTYCRLQYIIDILFSTFSFVFYSPTYLNILNIYALCRIDDISWGTKGINANVSGKNKQMSDQWKKIKIIHVSKFVLYNFVAGFLLLLFGDGYVVRFWITFSIMIILGFTLGLKVIIGSIYLLIYRCSNLSSKKNISHQRSQKDQIQCHFEKVKRSIYDAVQDSIENTYKKIKSQKEIPLPHATLSSKIYKSFRFGKDAKLGGGARFSKKADGISRIYNKNLEMGKSRVFQNGLKMSEQPAISKKNINPPQKMQSQNKLKSQKNIPAQYVQIQLSQQQQAALEVTQDQINMNVDKYSNDNLSDKGKQQLIINKDNQYKVKSTKKKTNNILGPK